MDTVIAVSVFIFWDNFLNNNDYVKKVLTLTFSFDILSRLSREGNT